MKRSERIFWVLDCPKGLGYHFYIHLREINLFGYQGTARGMPPPCCHQQQLTVVWMSRWSAPIRPLLTLISRRTSTCCYQVSVLQ